MLRQSKQASRARGSALLPSPAAARAGRGLAKAVKPRSVKASRRPATNPTGAKNKLAGHDAEILRRRAAGEEVKSLALRFGCSVPGIYKLIKRHSGQSAVRRTGRWARRSSICCYCDVPFKVDTSTVSMACPDCKSKISTHFTIWDRESDSLDTLPANLVKRYFLQG
jgi:hypothetical protein